jgi:phage shock protein C
LRSTQRWAIHNECKEAEGTWQSTSVVTAWSDHARVGVIAGVCAGLGRRFGLSPWTARILFILVLLVIPGSQLIVYPILWILMPSE